MPGHGFSAAHPKRVGDKDMSVESAKQWPVSLNLPHGYYVNICILFCK